MASRKTKIREQNAKETGPDSAGQSGDNQGLSDLAEAGPESVDELVQEGQFFEADVISGVEEAGEGGEVRTRQVRADDVPKEYDENEEKGDVK